MATPPDERDDYQRPLSRRPAPSPGDAGAGGKRTLASIEASPAVDFSRDVVQIERLTQFSYSSDVLQMADPFSIAVPDPRGQYRDKLLPGWSFRLSLQHPDVDGGARTEKVTGVVTQREASSDAGAGTVIRLTGADIGWHLARNDAPLWYNLRKGSLVQLAEACLFPHQHYKTKRGAAVADPNWGFTGVRTSNFANRKDKQRLKYSAAEEQGFALSIADGQITWVLVQPGQKIADLLVRYARRIGCLVGVSHDRALQFWLPNDSASSADYKITYKAGRESARNCAQSARRSDSLDGLYTDVTVVGERPFPVNVGDVKAVSPTFGKIYGHYSDHALLPFTRRGVFSDGEVTSRTARARAQWYAERGRFDSASLAYRVRGHHQNGVWWEPDSLCEVDDEVLGVSGAWYVAAVRYSSDSSSGDVTDVTLKPRGLLYEVAI